MAKRLGSGSRWLPSIAVATLVAATLVAGAAQSASALGGGGAGGGGGGAGGGGGGGGGFGGGSYGGNTGSNQTWYVQPTTTTAPDLARQIDVPTTRDGGLDGSGVGVALIDTGVIHVPGLAAAQIVNGPDLSLESQAPNLRYLDSYGHGTHMAGIIVGLDPTADYRGLAPHVKLTSVKVATGTGAVDVSQVIAALDWVVKHRNDDPTNPIRVINLSYGTDSTQDYRADPLSFAVENAWRAGIVVVVAGGNTGSAATRLTNPASDPGVLAVGSFSANGTPTRSDDTPSAFSSGSTGRKVDVFAPGESIVSLRNPGSYIDATYPTARVGSALFKGSGTSQATAVVSAAVALLLQKRPTLTPDQVKQLLRSTAAAMPAAGAAASGTGELDLGAALAAPVYTASAAAHGAGTGSLEAARGSAHLVDSNVELTGERDIFGAFSTPTWAAASSNGTAWNGGVWVGHRMAGDGWTGSSWASRTWAPGTWPGTSWSSIAWTATDWSGRYWSGSSWTGGNWTGRYWSDASWTSTGLTTPKPTPTPSKR